MTIPALINNTNKKELEAVFKKQYSILQQAILSIRSEDELDFTYENYGPRFSTRLAAQFKATEYCGEINHNTGCILLEEDDTFTYYKTLNGNTLSRAYFDDGGFLTSDGVLYLFEQGEQSQFSGFLVSIDVNGFKRKPNRMGYDLFMFHITKDGRVLPVGAENTWLSYGKDTYCSETSTSNMNGFTCAYFALTDNNYFKNLK